MRGGERDGRWEGGDVRGRWDGSEPGWGHSQRRGRNSARGQGCKSLMRRVKEVQEAPAEREAGRGLAMAIAVVVDSAMKASASPRPPSVPCHGRGEPSRVLVGGHGFPGGGLGPLGGTVSDPGVAVLGAQVVGSVAPGVAGPVARLYGDPGNARGPDGFRAV